MADPQRSPADAKPRVAVVVLNRDGARHIEHCLDSLWRAEPRPACVTVVDNASSDASVSLVREWAAAHGLALAEHEDDARLPADDGRPVPWLLLLRLSEHRGAPGGNNAGLRLLFPRRELTHFLVLDNDTEVARDYFAALDEALREVPDAGLLSGTIYEFDDRSRVAFAGGRSLPWRALVLHEHEVPADPRPRPSQYLTLCALVVSRRALEVLGPIPEAYFPIYSEDSEYSYRARAAGLPVIYAPRPVVYHKIGTTVGRAVAVPRAMYLDTRHRAFYVRRNFRGLDRWAAIAYLLVTKPGRAVLELVRGRPAMAAAVLRGTFGGLTSRAAWHEGPPLQP